MSSNKKRVTYWLDEQGENDNDAPVSVSREDNSVLIETELAGEHLHVFIGPSLFGKVREAMDRAERRTPADGPSWRESAERLEAQLSSERRDRFAMIRALANIRDSAPLASTAYKQAKNTLVALRLDVPNPASREGG